MSPVNLDRLWDHEGHEEHEGFQWDVRVPVFTRRVRRVSVYLLQRQNAVGLMDRGVSADDVGRDFQQRQRLDGPSLQS